MIKWFNVVDIYHAKGMRDVIGSYRGRIARTHVQYVRHISAKMSDTGRPQRVTLITQEGIETMYSPDEVIPDFQPFDVPMRLTDAARRQAVTPGFFTTEGLEKRPSRELTRQAFIAFLMSIKNEEMIEPDFIPL